MKETKKVAQAIQVINEVEQVKLYRLFLNPLNLPKRIALIVAIAYEKETLMKWYKDQLKDDVNYHDFSSDGPLFWYNEISALSINESFKINEYHHGIDEIWTTEKQIEKFLTESPDVILLPADESIPLPVNIEGLKSV